MTQIMSALNRIVLGSAIASAVCGSACASKPSSDPSSIGVKSQTIIGDWKSDWVETQLGMTKEGFCFTSEGEVVGYHEFRDILPRKRTSNSGTYKLEGDQLTFTWPSTGSSATVKVGWKGDILVLSERRGTREYGRMAPNCEALIAQPAKPAS